MKKKLYILRHARAEEYSDDRQDAHRKLDSIGLQNATRMGIYLNSRKVDFDMIISSPAIRAVSTASLIAEQIKYDTNTIHKNDEIYEASVRTLLRLVNQLKEEWHSVLIVGHNPSATFLAEYITKSEIGDLTTCGIVHIEFEDLLWNEISEGTGRLISYDYPDSLNF